MKLALNMRAGSISTLTSQKDTKTLFHKMFDAHFEEHDTIMPWSNQQRERRPRANTCLVADGNSEKFMTF